jgi:tetratricopeptide (TPR) repeat protein
VAELNSRNLGMAVEHLGKACKLSPKSEDIRYALAAAYALEGNLDAALEHLRAAIELRPENRFQARQDKDFRSLMADPRFRSLVLAEVTQTVGMPKMQNRVTSQERLET